MGSTPVESIKFYHAIQPRGAPWQPTIGPRGTTSLDRKKTIVTKSFAHLSASVSALLACQLIATSLYECTAYTIICYVSTVRTVQSTKILHVWKNEQNVISFAYDVRLSPFKLCWVRNDKAYTHVRFEVILRTLIFRPSWTHFGSWIHFGSHLPTNTFWSSKRILTSDQVWDRPPHLLPIFKLCHGHLSHQDQLQNNHDN
jgi:hypothetical protein